MLILQNISYQHENKDMLFQNINFTVNNNDKVALVGNNGVGKSTLLKIISGELKSFSGQIIQNSEPYFIPQLFGQFDEISIAEALKISDKIKSLKEILEGIVTEENLQLLDNDWTIEERCEKALSYWNLHELDLNQKMETLSGGQKTKVFLAGIMIHEPEFILMDEPSNHLDSTARELLYDFIKSTSSSLLIVSHDRTLLNILNRTLEMSKNEIFVYGGNYDFYHNQKKIMQEALENDVQNKEKELKKAKDKERETIERQNKLDSRGKKKQEKSGVARIMMNTLRNNAENSSSKLKDVHAEKISNISGDLRQLRSNLPIIDQIKFGFNNSNFHKGKVLFKATEINFSYENEQIWKENLSFEILSGDRLSVKGINGSGKTTLIKIILGELTLSQGTINSQSKKAIYIDQDYSMLQNDLKVYEQAQLFNDCALEEHDIKMRLNRFLFSQNDWDKLCNVLSGGERMRLMLCCLTISNESPEIIILDEPTNNLDIQNIEILTAALNEYKGTLIVISHDHLFLNQVNIEKSIEL
ncbi:ATPase subunit of ABC transporter with duplicated ATPase domains [Flavobacterium nitrogenifigens]|uniref:ATPase subunit of ABC transporter with duplicated ATPase domains n=2 Tax=Flavobacterium TaxID=237 RepID=A0A7W7J0E1_9FLAO|nr:MULTISPECIES: ABC-F family ATP-binding cassette domain-containing protein [Flavobacterium]MBB4803936.1 ATPase subunit of ABC transporter with duplicated ATPase domains [Flavobacterium nitrogenifigens]MBB6388912.1 ATPase subunit of ABC transporter with duplicated ATPase domains [Flavobacterium notoginsengisoli]